MFLRLVVDLRVIMVQGMIPKVIQKVKLQVARRQNLADRRWMVVVIKMIGLNILPMELLIRRTGKNKAKEVRIHWLKMKMMTMKTKKRPLITGSE